MGGNTDPSYYDYDYDYNYYRTIISKYLAAAMSAVDLPTNCSNNERKWTSFPNTLSSNWRDSFPHLKGKRTNGGPTRSMPT